MKFLKNYRVVIVIAAICMNTNSSNCQDVFVELKRINDFNKSVSDMGSALNRMSRHFTYYNKEDKKSADELIMKIMGLPESLRSDRNQFLFNVFVQLDSAQRQYIRNVLTIQIKDSDPLYNELVSLYKLTDHFGPIYSKIDTSAIRSIKSQFTSKGYISEYNIKQLKYISTLANLGDAAFYEDELLQLIKDLYRYSKGVEDKKRRNSLLVHLYNQIMPNSIGKIYSKSSVVNSLYLIDEPEVVEFSSDVSDSYLAWDYIFKSVLSKMAYLDGKYLSVNKFYENIDNIKEELLNNKSIWHSHIKM